MQDHDARRDPIALPPPLKWAGGKRWLVPLLRRLYAPHRGARLADPFVGGMAVPLGLLPERALLSDANPHLVSLCRWLARGLTIEQPMRNEASAYYAARDRFNALLREGRHETAEAAGLFYYLNRTGYNGLCRFNRAGAFNVPFGSYGSIAYVTDFSAYAGVLRGWEIAFGDFEDVRLEPGDFVYADPPYDVEFTQYAQGGFAWSDQERLAAWLADHPGPVVASNQATERVMGLYRRFGFRVTTLDAPRRISCTGDRTPAREMVAVRNLAPESLEALPER